ncbi:F-box/LRR-repeat protein 17-like [Salvia hispanica]|uniref:F-box/LRR-repeat protein 17-like n=1 Tax=Salvia hispanica TaxID=49212 RepID=UPI002009B3C5|nr:F-box/LRR-repeat protein 17-like [Salvia hispanica]
MLDIAFMDILNKSQECFSRLTILSLRGACGLSDDGIRNLVKSAPLLRSINLGQCTLLTSAAVNCIADVLGSQLKELYIDECNKIDAMQILPAFKKFTCLEVLSVAQMRTINDQFVNGLVTASACGKVLKDLDFSDCNILTDNSLKIIGTTCDDLHSLDISNLNKLTDSGLEYLANGCKSIQKLKLCRNEFSDEAVAAFLESSGESLLELFLNSIVKVGPHTALSLAKCSRKLVSLDLSWCRKISNEGLGLIVDSCSSLKMLKIFGCTQINKEFLEGHSNPVVKIIGSKFTPIMDHLYLLEPEEEKFLRYRFLQY